MRSLMLACLLLVLPACVSAQDTLTGTYTVEGLNDDGSTYTFQADVVEEGGVLSLSMRNERGDVAVIALGLREGDIVSTVFQTSDGAIGLAVYRIEGDTWRGRWIVPGAPGILTETLTKVDPRLHGAEQGPKSVL